MFNEDFWNSNSIENPFNSQTSIPIPEGSATFNAHDNLFTNSEDISPNEQVNHTTDAVNNVNDTWINSEQLGHASHDFTPDLTNEHRTESMDFPFMPKYGKGGKGFPKRSRLMAKIKINPRPYLGKFYNKIPRDPVKTRNRKNSLTIDPEVIENDVSKIEETREHCMLDETIDCDDPLNNLANNWLQAVNLSYAWHPGYNIEEESEED